MPIGISDIYYLNLMKNSGLIKPSTTPPPTIPQRSPISKFLTPTLPTFDPNIPGEYTDTQYTNLDIPDLEINNRTPAGITPNDSISPFFRDLINKVDKLKFNGASKSEDLGSSVIQEVKDKLKMKAWPKPVGVDPNDVVSEPIKELIERLQTTVVPKKVNYFDTEESSFNPENVDAKAFSPEVLRDFSNKIQRVYDQELNDRNMGVEEARRMKGILEHNLGMNQLDLSPLIALAENESGKKLMSGYTKPTTFFEKIAPVEKLRQAIQAEEQGITKSQLDAFKEQIDLRKAIANEQNQRGMLDILSGKNAVGQETANVDNAIKPLKLEGTLIGKDLDRQTREAIEAEKARIARIKAATTKKGGEDKPTAGEIQTDRLFAKSAEDWTNKGRLEVQNALKRLQNAISGLGKKNVVGLPSSGPLMGIARTFGVDKIVGAKSYEYMLDTLNTVYSVIKTYLPGAITEKEVDLFVNSKFDPSLDTRVNQKNLGMTLDNLLAASKEMDKKTKYYYGNRKKLRGWDTDLSDNYKTPSSKEIIREAAPIASKNMYKSLGETIPKGHPDQKILKEATQIKDATTRQRILDRLIRKYLPQNPYGY